LLTGCVEDAGGAGATGDDREIEAGDALDDGLEGSGGAGGGDGEVDRDRGGWRSDDAIGECRDGGVGQERAGKA
jgi:hypothetical protein